MNWLHCEPFPRPLGCPFVLTAGSCPHLARAEHHVRAACEIAFHHLVPEQEVAPPVTANPKPRVPRGAARISRRCPTALFAETNRAGFRGNRPGRRPCGSSFV